MTQLSVAIVLVDCDSRLFYKVKPTSVADSSVVDYDILLFCRQKPIQF